MRKIAVAMFSDTCMLPGMHVTISTLLQSLEKGAENNLELHLFLDRVTDQHKLLLQATHQKYDRGMTLFMHDYSPSAPPRARAFFGNNSVYGRLYLADLLAEHDKCIYLDSDLLVNRSIHLLSTEFDDHNVLLADGCWQRFEDHDRDLFAIAKLDPRGFCFNSGVMGMNLELWRRRNINLSLIRTMEQFKDLIYGDQVLLNLTLHDLFKPVGQKWNRPLFPATPAISELEPCIYHLVGSPKPWDFMSRFLHNHYQLWLDQYKKTAIGSESYLHYSSLKRSLSISGMSLKRFFRILTRRKHPES